MNRKIHLIFLLLCYTCMSFANQNFEERKKEWVIHANFHYGKVIKHTSKFLPDIPNNSVMSELNVGIITGGNKHWHQRFRYPETGFTLIYGDFGNMEVLGRGVGLFPYISLPLTNGNKYKFEIAIGSGIAYLNQPFNIIDNNTNNVIGSKINNVTQLKFLNSFKVKETFYLTAGLAFTHFSNGKVQKPNLGINVLSGNVGLKFFPNGHPEIEMPDSISFEVVDSNLSLTGCNYGHNDLSLM